MIDIDLLIDQYERVWAAGKTPDLAEFLGAYPDSVTDESLQELIKVDIHRRWTFDSGSSDESTVRAVYQTSVDPPAPLSIRYRPPLKVEEYLTRFPQIETAANYPYELIEEELIARFHASDPTSVHELYERFPHADRTRLTHVWRAARDYVDHDSGGADVNDKSERLHDRAFGLTGLVSDRFRIIRPLAQGGMGRVYLAHDPRLNRRVAIKLPLIDVRADPVAQERFLREGRAAGSVSHPNIVPVFEVTDSDEACFIVSEFIDGPSLKEWLRSLPEPLPVRVAAQLAAAIARGVDAAHNSGVIHRDLKPANVLLSIQEARKPSSDSNPLSNSSVLFEGKSIRPRITDFGLAWLQEASASLTGTGALLGTVRYMSPEHVGGKATGPQSDVFSLGVILYEMLTGNVPFSSDNYAVAIDHILHRDPVPAKKMRSEVSRDLSAICERALCKELGNRYQTAEALANDLSRYLTNQPIEARETSRLGRAWKWVKRNPLPSLLGGLLCVALVWSGWQNRQLMLALGEAKLHRGRAEASRVAADVARGDADDARAVAEDRSEALRQQVYVRDMQRAYDAWNRGWVREVPGLLSAQVPKAGETDHRGFEWYALAKYSRLPPSFDLQGHTGPVRDVAVFDDGSRLASVGADGVIRIWDVEARKEAFVLEDTRSHSLGWLREAWGKLNLLPGDSTRKRGYRAVSVSSDGKKLATGDLVLSLWDLEERKHIRNLTAFLTPVFGVAFSPSGDAVAAHAPKDGVRVYSVDGDRMVSRATRHGSYRIDFSEDGSRLAVPCREKVSGIVCLDALQWQETEDVKIGIRDEIHGMVHNDDGRYLFVATGAAHVLLVDVESGETVCRSSPYRATANDIDISRDNQAVAVAHDDGTVAIWRLAHNWRTNPDECFSSEPKWIPRHDGAVNAVQFLSDRDVASCGDDGLIRITSLAEAEMPRTLVTDRNFDRCEFAVEGRRLVVTTLHGIRMYDTQTWEVLDTIEFWQPSEQDPHDNEVTALSVCGDGRTVGVGNGIGQIVVFDLKERRILARYDQFDKRRSAISSLSFSPDRVWLATAGRDHTLRVRSIEEGREVYRTDTKGFGQCVRFSPDGTRLACSDNERLLLLLETGTWRECGRAAVKSGPRALVFSHDGRNVITGHYDSTIRVWETENMTQMAELRGHARTIHSLFVHPGGKTLVSTSSDETMRLWHLPTATCIGTLLSGTGKWVRGCSVSPNGLHLAAMSSTEGRYGGIVHIWSVPEFSAASGGGDPF